MTIAPFRRVVTGHDAHGRAIIQADAPPPRVQRIGGETGPWFYEVWNTQQTPAIIDRASDEPAEDGIQLAAPKKGTRIRVLDIPPEGDDLEAMTPEMARAHFAEVGAADASSFAGTASRHAYMHRTQTVDYGIILDGEITLIVDEGETVVRAGDIVVQRGTNHGWANRSGKNCRIAFVLIDGTYTDGLFAADADADASAGAAEMLTLAFASGIVDGALADARRQGFAPLCVVVLDAGGQPRAMKREDGSAISRPEMATAKAAGCLGMGFGGRELARRAQAMPGFIAALNGIFPHGILPVPGGVLIRDRDGRLLGAVGISGDTSDKDEICALAGIAAVGLVAETGA